jgi:hypothetical protein
LFKSLPHGLASSSNGLLVELFSARRCFGLGSGWPLVVGSCIVLGVAWPRPPNDYSSLNAARGVLIVLSLTSGGSKPAKASVVSCPQDDCWGDNLCTVIDSSDRIFRT